MRSLRLTWFCAALSVCGTAATITDRRKENYYRSVRRSLQASFGDEPCKPGTLGFGGVNCLPCPENTYTATSGQRMCIPCESHETSNPSRTGCVSRLPTSCPAGFYGFGGRNCLPCAEGQITPTEGMRECISCGPGEASSADSTKCIKMFTGPDELQTFEPTIEPTGQPTSAPAQDSTSVPTADLSDSGQSKSSGSNSDAAPCPAGSFGAGGRSCWPCFEGTITSRPGQFQCTPCEDGQMSNPTRTECISCPAGSFGSGGNSCWPCFEGTITSKPGQLQCTACADGKIANPTKTACTDPPTTTTVAATMRRRSMTSPTTTTTTTSPATTSTTSATTSTTSVTITTTSAAVSTLEPTSSPTNTPTGEPSTDTPTTSPTTDAISFFDRIAPPSDTASLDECEFDCTSDDDCFGDLICGAEHEEELKMFGMDKRADCDFLNKDSTACFQPLVLTSRLFRLNLALEVGSDGSV